VALVKQEKLTIPTVFGQIQPKKIPQNFHKSGTFAE
jgi:hypothetical protein